MHNPHCPLCSGALSDYLVFRERQFLQCENCLSIITHPKDFLTPEEEVKHYKKHNNIPTDPRYQNFVSPIVNAIRADWGTAHTGLDFGSGTGSPIIKMLQDDGYTICQYDLYFHPFPELLNHTYNYIACSEVAEHFKEPYSEFVQLHRLLKPGGKLYLMTDRFKPEEREFKAWQYKNDPTHIFLYHARAFEWIKQEFGFKSLEFYPRMVVLEKGA
jgi:SAM-dependent methyltransferase